MHLKINYRIFQMYSRKYSYYFVNAISAVERHRVQWTNNTNAIGKDLNLVEKQYVDNNFLKLSGGTISGNLDIQSDIDMNGKQINDLSDPRSTYDACTKGYVDRILAQKLQLDSSNMMTDNLNMGSNKITNLKLATNDNDATSNVYVYLFK